LVLHKQNQGQLNKSSSKFGETVTSLQRSQNLPGSKAGQY